jgi:hypothetical protein
MPGELRGFFGEYPCRGGTSFTRRLFRPSPGIDECCSSIPERNGEGRSRKSLKSPAADGSSPEAARSRYERLNAHIQMNASKKPSFQTAENRPRYIHTIWGSCLRWRNAKIIYIPKNAC